MGWHAALALLLAAFALAAPTHADDVSHARQLESEGQIVPLDQVLARARLEQPGRLLEVELEHEHHGYVYEVKILDAGGRLWELEFDAATGHLVERELDPAD